MIKALLVLGVGFVAGRAWQAGYRIRLDRPAQLPAGPAKRERSKPRKGSKKGGA